MSIEKISDSALEQQGKFHACLDDVPGLSAGDMKGFFDYIPRQVLIPKVNELADAANAASAAMAGKLDKQLQRTNRYDNSAIFAATLATEGNPVTFTVTPHVSGGGYVDGVAIGGTAPVYLGNNVQVPLNVPALTVGAENTVEWSWSGPGSYTGGNIPDYLALHADSPLINLTAWLQNTEGIAAQYSLTLNRVSKSGNTCFVTPPIFDTDYNNVFAYVFGTNGYYCVQL